jgi:hypothetical protein
MSRRMPSSYPPDEWPPYLRLLVLAAERECPAGHAGALKDLTALALTKVPARGIFDPASRGEHDLFAAIDAVATRHLGMAGARSAWRRAVQGARLELETRDKVERAAQQVQGVSDTAYFYAGLAFGLTCVALFRQRL